MKKKAIFVIFSVFVILFALSAGQEQKQTKSLILPQGTKLAKTDDGCLNFTLPEGCVIRARGFVKSPTRAVIIGDCGTVSDWSVLDQNGKLIATVKEGRLISGQKPASAQSGDRLTVEGVTVYLPARIEFSQPRIFNRLAFEKLIGS